MYRFLKIILFLPVLLFTPTKVVGKHNIDKKGKVIIACNHLTYLDVILLGIYLKRRIYFIGKKELFKHKFLGWLLKKLGVICVDRDKLEIATVKNILNVLKNENVIGIFPEGTRNKTGEVMLEFKDGVTLFAEKTGAPVVPIIIKRKPLIFVPNKIIIGEKMYFEKGNEDNTQILYKTMYDMRLKEMKKNGTHDKRVD